MTDFLSKKQMNAHKRKMQKNRGYSTKNCSSNSEKMDESKIKKLNINLRQQRLINRNLTFELRAYKKCLDEEKRKNQPKFKRQNKG